MENKEVYNSITKQKLESTIKEIFGDKENFNLLGITKINNNCYQVIGNNGFTFITGKLGILEYIKAFQEELIKYSNTILQDGE